MRSTSIACALLAAALLASGCRTLNRSRDRVTAADIPFETASRPARVSRSAAPAPAVVEERVVAAPVSAEPTALETPAVAVPAASVSVGKVTAREPEIDTTPYEVQVVRSADQVGLPGSYVEQVIPADGGDTAYAIEADGLTGSTGRHVPAPAPEPEPVPVVKPAPAGSGVYVVQAGDVLGRIAAKHGVSRQAILDANPSVKDPNKLKVGQKLKIPARGTGISDKPKTVKKTAPAAAAKKKTLPAKEGFTVYTVKKGDILGRVALANKTTQKAILEANGLTDANKIREGQQLYVPVAGDKASAAADKPAKSAATKASSKSSAKPAKDETAPADPAAGDAAADDILSSLGL